MKTWRSGHLARLIALIVLALVLSGGCMSKMRADSGRPVDLSPIRVIQAGDIRNYVNARLGVLIFEAPDFAPGIGERVPKGYAEALTSKNLFRGVTAIPAGATGDEGVVWQGRKHQCDLVLAGRILRVSEGSGAMPTRLKARIRVLDTRSGRVVWDVEQEAHSEPGYDVDLYWTTFEGENAQRVEALERALANQFVAFLLEPVLGKGKNSPW